MKREQYHPTLAALLLSCGATVAQTTYPIVDTNQIQYYDNSGVIQAPQRGDSFYGQDANYQGNTPSYTDNGDGTITDNVTGLIWQKDFSVMSYDEAMAAAKSLTLGGRSDWRLPSIKEAYSLIMFSGVDASNRDMNSVPEGAVPFIDTRYFDFKYGANGTRAIDTQMISSTIYVGSTGRMKLIFGVNMADGRIKGYPMSTREGGKSFTVRFVCGEEYGANKFVDNKDKSVSDLATGLMWQKEDSGRGMDWQSALEYAEKMNQKRYLGYDDWRLPNAKELQSIVDYTRSPESSSTAAIDPVFHISSIKGEDGERDYPFFWSSTTHSSVGLRGGAGGAAAYVSFGRGLGNMQQMQQSGSRGNSGVQQRTQRTQQMHQSGNMGGMQRPSQGQFSGGNGGSSSSSENWIDIHGAGCQRSDPKSGDASQYSGGRGPQGDAIRIKNYVRLVRDIAEK